MTTDPQATLSRAAAQTVYEVRYTPESYYVGVVVADKSLADSVLALIRERATSPGDWRVAPVELAGGSPLELAEAAAETVADMTGDFDFRDLFECPRGPGSVHCEQRAFHTGPCDGDDPCADPTCETTWLHSEHTAVLEPRP